MGCVPGWRSAKIFRTNHRPVEPSKHCPRENLTVEPGSFGSGSSATVPWISKTDNVLTKVNMKGGLSWPLVHDGREVIAC